MLRYRDWTTLQAISNGRSLRKLLSAVSCVAILLLPSFASAAIIDFEVATGNWDSSLDVFPDDATVNWADRTTAPLVPVFVSIPATTDTASIRNGGTVSVTTSQTIAILQLGFAGRQVELDPINAPGVLTDVATNGAMSVTGGTFTAGQLLIGKALNGVVTQSGGDIAASTSTNFDLGDSGSTNPGTGTYTMTGGTITMIGGTNGNNGIEVINGTFNLKGGTINQTSGAIQRVFRIGTKNLTTATVNITGGTINSTVGGIRVGDGGTSTGVLNISEDDGPVNITLGADLSVGRSASTTAASLGKMTMSAGTLTIGTASANAKLQAGNAGPGQITMTGGSINVFNGLRVGQSPLAQGSFFDLKGGTVTTRDFDSHTDAASVLSPETTGSRFTIDGGIYNQIAGQMDIGQKGKTLVELKSGSATVPQIQMGTSTDSKATLSISGGVFTLGGALNRTVFTGNDTFGAAMTAPVINLTGGKLDMTSTAASVNWQADMNLNGTELLTRLNNQLVVNVGDASRPGNFTMNSGMWDIDLNGHTVNNADRVLVGNTLSTGAINGGTLNLNYISGYTPVVGDSIRIVTTTGAAPTVNSGAINIVAPASLLGVWTTNVVGQDIRLEFIPEPTTSALAIMGLMFGIVGFRRRS
jgi:hypothetical protein